MLNTPIYFCFAGVHTRQKRSKNCNVCNTGKKPVLRKNIYIWKNVKHGFVSNLNCNYNFCRIKPLFLVLVRSQHLSNSPRFSNVRVELAISHGFHSNLRVELALVYSNLRVDLAISHAYGHRIISHSQYWVNFQLDCLPRVVCSTLHFVRMSDKHTVLVFVRHGQVCSVREPAHDVLFSRVFAPSTTYSSA